MISEKMGKESCVKLVPIHFIASFVFNVLLILFLTMLLEIILFENEIISFRSLCY